MIKRFYRGDHSVFFLDKNSLEGGIINDKKKK